VISRNFLLKKDHCEEMKNLPALDLYLVTWTFLTLGISF